MTLRFVPNIDDLVDQLLLQYHKLTALHTQPVKLVFLKAHIFQGDYELLFQLRDKINRRTKIPYDRIFFHDKEVDIDRVKQQFVDRIDSVYTDNYDYTIKFSDFAEEMVEKVYEKKGKLDDP